MTQYKSGVCEWGGHLAKTVREGLPREVAIELCLQNEQVKEEREECAACAKALWWEGTRRTQGPEGRWLKVSRLRGGGWRCGWGQSTWDLEGHLEEVRMLPDL